MDILTEKKKLRSALRRMRQELPDEERMRMDAEIFRKVMVSPWFQEADTLLLYVSCKGEVDTIRIIEKSLELGKQVAVPKCGKNGTMQFYLIKSFDELAKGAYGIPEPTGTSIPAITEKTVCFVPAVAYTPQGSRLGQGGGYYDRFLEQYPALRTIGICYDCMLMPDLPCEPHDRNVDAVITN